MDIHQSALFFGVTMQHAVEKHIAITGLLKATPATEGDKRFVYIEASNEALDVQGERVLAQALKASQGYYLKYGNLDLDHITQIGMRSGLPDFHFYEIGLPIDVRIDDRHTFLKGSIFQGEGKSAERANEFWKSITAQSPPQRWFPSVGGSIMSREPGTDPKHGKIAVVTGVRWTNTGFSKTPVNCAVAGVSTIPIGTFAKAWGAAGLDLTDPEISKTLTAGYGTDSATLTGGGALREQSLEGAPLKYLEFRERISGDLRTKRLKNPSRATLADWAMTQYGLGSSLAKEWADRFVADLSTHLMRNAS